MSAHCAGDVFNSKARTVVNVSCRLLSGKGPTATHKIEWTPGLGIKVFGMLCGSAIGCSVFPVFLQTC